MPTSKKSLPLLLKSLTLLLFLAPLAFADSIDDAEAKRRGISSEQVRLERENTTLKQTLDQRDKEIASLKAQLNRPQAANLPASQPAAKESWITKPPAQWPLIHLSNDVKLTQNRTMGGASASLIKLDDGRVFGVTARHLMGPDGGIDPALKLAEIDTNVLSWILHPYAAPQPQVRLGKLATKLTDEGLHDCLMFPATGDLTRLPALALKPRTTPLKPGDKLFLLGCPFTVTPYRQNAYPGTVTTITDDGRVNFTLEADLATRGFSGAPVIDDDGHFAGVYSGHYIPRDGITHQTFHDVYMVSTATILDLLPAKK